MRNDQFQYDDVMILSIELSKVLKSYNETLRRISPQDANGRVGRLQHCDELKIKARELLMNYKTELRAIRSPEERNSFVADLKAQYQKFTELHEIHEKKMYQVDRSAFERNDQAINYNNITEPNNTGTNEGNNGQAAPPDPMTIQQMQEKGDAIQDQIQNRLNDMKRNIAGAEAIGIAAGEEIDRQIEQGDRINDGE